MAAKHQSEEKGIIKRSLSLRRQMVENKTWRSVKWRFMDKQTAAKDGDIYI